MKEILTKIVRIHGVGMSVKSCWTYAHVSVEGNGNADKIAK